MLEVKSISCPEDKSQIKKSDGKGLFFGISALGIIFPKFVILSGVDL